MRRKKDNLKVVIHGNEADGYRVTMFDGEDFVRNVVSRNFSGIFWTVSDARRAGKRALRRERDRRGEQYYSEIR